MSNHNDIICTNQYIINEVEQNLDNKIPDFIIEKYKTVNNTNIMEYENSILNFGNTFFLIYEINNKSYIDIHQLLSNMQNLTKEQYLNMFKNYSDKIEYSFLKEGDNKRIYRELISMEIFYDIMIKNEKNKDLNNNINYYLIITMMIFYAYLYIYITIRVIFE